MYYCSSLLRAILTVMLTVGLAWAGPTGLHGTALPANMTGLLAPSDASIAVGSTYVVAVQNEHMYVYDISGNLKQNWGDNATSPGTCNNSDSTGNGCFWPFDYDTGSSDSLCGTTNHPDCVDFSDPRVEYDPVNGYYIVTSMSFSGTSGKNKGLDYVFIAETNNPNQSAANWKFYEVEAGNSCGSTNDNCSGGTYYNVDFPQIGMSANWLTLVNDCFDGPTYEGQEDHAIELSNLETGSMHDHCHQDPSWGTDTRSMPARMVGGDPTNSGAYFVRITNRNSNCVTCDCHTGGTNVGFTNRITKLHGTVSSPTWTQGYEVFNDNV